MPFGHIPVNQRRLNTSWIVNLGALLFDLTGLIESKGAE
jgi:hypothetical protein